MKYLTVGEAADRIGISKGAVYQLCSRQGAAIRHLRVGVAGATIRIPEKALDEYMEAATVEPSAKEEKEAASSYVPRHFKY